MRLEFTLPSGAGGAAAGTAAERLKRQLKDWCYHHATSCKTRIDGYKLIVELAREADYSLFAISWNIEPGLKPQYCL